MALIKKLWEASMPAKMSRAAYADMFGPTVGDKMRLADTELFVEVEKDFTTETFATSL